MHQPCTTFGADTAFGGMGSKDGRGDVCRIPIGLGDVEVQPRSLTFVRDDRREARKTGAAGRAGTAFRLLPGIFDIVPLQLAALTNEMWRTNGAREGICVVFGSQP